MRLIVGALLLAAMPVLAQNSVTLTERTTLSLLRGSTAVETINRPTAAEAGAACLDRMRALARAATQTSGTATYTCQTERQQVIATYSTAPPQPPPPPPPPVGGTYDLGDIPAEYRAVQFATLPTISRTVNVTPGGLGGAIASGTRIIAAAGSYSGVGLVGSDIDLVLANGATVGGISFRCQRCRVSGGVINANGGYVDILDEAQHVTIDNVRIEGGVNMFPWNGRNPHHITVLRSTITARTGAGMLIGANLDHIILAGNNISNFDPAGWGIRTSSIRYLVGVDNRIFSVANGRRPLREHADGTVATLHLWARNQIESNGNGNLWWGPNSSGSQTAGSNISGVQFVNNSFYAPLSGNVGAVAQIDSDVGGRVDPIVIRGNRFFTPDTRFSDGASKYLDQGGNVFAPYQAPPAFVGGANH
jgi:hypothetical protein